MIEPVNSDHHVAAPRLPHALYAADERQVGPAGRQEHSTVTDADHLSATHNSLIEELLSFALHTASLEVGVRRGQSWSQSERTDIRTKTLAISQNMIMKFSIYCINLSPHLCGFPKPLPELSGWKESRNLGPVLHTGKPLTFSQLLGCREMDPLSPLWSPHLPLSSAGLWFRRTTPLPGPFPGGWFSGFSWSRSSRSRRG